MRKLTVNTTVTNEVCDERRTLTFDNTNLAASVFMDDKELVWASNARGLWTLGLGKLMVHDITDKQMISLVNSITNETEKENNGSSNEGA